MKEWKNYLQLPTDCKTTIIIKDGKQYSPNWCTDSTWSPSKSQLLYMQTNSDYNVTQYYIKSQGWTIKKNRGK